MSDFTWHYNVGSASVHAYTLNAGGSVSAGGDHWDDAIITGSGSLFVPDGMDVVIAENVEDLGFFWAGPESSMGHAIVDSFWQGWPRVVIVAIGGDPTWLYGNPSDTYAGQVVDLTGVFPQVGADLFGSWGIVTNPYVPPELGPVQNLVALPA